MTTTPPDDPAGAVSTARRDRAVSDTVGFVLVFSLVITTVALVSVAGLSSLESARDAEQTNNAERAMEVLRDNVGDVTEGGAPSRATEISLEDASLRLGEETLIEVRDPANGVGSGSFLTKTTFNVRPVVYDDGDTQLVYVMGAVFRADPRGGTVVQPWSPVVDPERTVVPLVDTSSATGGSQSIQTDTVLVRASLNRRIVHVSDEAGTYNNVWINVTSSRHELWKRMLGDHPGIDCPSPDPDPDEVQCKLTYTPEEFYVVDTRIAVALKR